MVTRHRRREAGPDHDPRRRCSSRRWTRATQLRFTDVDDRRCVSAKVADDVRVEIDELTPTTTAAQLHERLTGGQAAGRPQPFPFDEPGNRTRVLGISSGKGGVGQVVGHGQHWPSPWPSAATRSPSSTPTSTASRSRRCSASSEDPISLDDMIVPPVAHGVAVISMGFFVERRPGRDLARPDAAQGARAVPRRRVLGRARLPRSSTCRPAPATSRCRWRSTSRGPRSTSSRRRRPPRSASPSAPRRWPRRSTCRCAA